MTFYNTFSVRLTSLGQISCRKLIYMRPNIGPSAAGPAEPAATVLLP